MFPFIKIFLFYGNEMLQCYEKKWKSQNKSIQHSLSKHFIKIQCIPKKSFNIKNAKLFILLQMFKTFTLAHMIHKWTEF